MKRMVCLIALVPVVGLSIAAPAAPAVAAANQATEARKSADLESDRRLDASLVLPRGLKTRDELLMALPGAISEATGATIISLGRFPLGASEVASFKAKPVRDLMKEWAELSGSVWLEYRGAYMLMPPMALRPSVEPKPLDRFYPELRRKITGNFYGDIDQVLLKLGYQNGATLILGPIDSPDARRLFGDYSIGVTETRLEDLLEALSAFLGAPLDHYHTAGVLCLSGHQLTVAESLTLDKPLHNRRLIATFSPEQIEKLRSAEGVSARQLTVEQRALLGAVTVSMRAKMGVAADQLILRIPDSAPGVDLGIDVYAGTITGSRLGNIPSPW